jgi:acyl-CoA reductase-like NAD-dependent aldehyde dehydrogenase
VGKVALVLGAGNIASIAPLDVLYKLIAEGQVCLLKMNPVNDYLGPFLEEAFRSLIAQGFVRIAYGGADVGAWLANHALVEEIHITGSARTHDAIVFGGGSEGAARKAKDEPVNRRRVTSELGNVSPTIVVPAPCRSSCCRLRGTSRNRSSTP